MCIGACPCVIKKTKKRIKTKLREQCNKKNQRNKKENPNLSFFGYSSFNFRFNDGHSCGHQTQIGKTLLHD